MEYRKLVNSDLNVSAVGIGCWAMGGAAWGATDDNVSIAAIQKALDLGINFLDTAPAYGKGHSEEIVGKAIKGRRDKAFIATKCGLEWNKKGRIWNNASRERLFKEIDECRERLDVDVIDLWQVHWPDPHIPIQETMEAMVKIKELGKIRAIGVSNFSPGQMEECLKYAQLVSDQPPYNMLHRDIEKDVLPFCREHNVGVVTYGSICRGLLSGKFKKGNTFPKNDLRSRDPSFNEKFEENLAIVEKLRPLAEKYGKTLAQLAINWVISQPGVTVAICGAKRPEQVEDNAGGADWRISDEDLAEIETIIS